MSSEKRGKSSVYSAALTRHCHGLLQSLCRGTLGAVSATIATSDGLPVASTLADKKEVAKLSAIAGSISALASAFTREAGHEEPERVVLESPQGHIVSIKIATPVLHLVLTIVADKTAVLGKVLWSGRVVAESIATFSKESSV